MNKNNNFFLGAPGAALIIAAGIILSTIIAAYTFLEVRGFDNTISVTGSAKQAVKADQVKWITLISRSTTESGLKNAYYQISSDLKSVQKFFADNNVPESDITINPVSMNEVYYYEKNPSSEKRYDLRQTIEIKSKDVESVSKLSKNAQALINQGVLFTTQSLEYSYSKLADLRVSMLSKAVSDARARAGEIVAGTGKEVGTLKSASSGVVQVLASGSNEVSDYGAYDTSGIDKDVMVTVKAVFLLK